PLGGTGGTRPGRARGRRWLRGPAARGQQSREAQPRSPHPGGSQEAPARHARMQQASQQREVRFVVIRHRALHPFIDRRHPAHACRDRRPMRSAPIGCRLPSERPSRKGGAMSANDERLRDEAVQQIKRRRELWKELVSYLIVNAGLIVVWAITGAGYFWPGWVLGGWGIGLLFHAWATFRQEPIEEDEMRRG